MKKIIETNQLVLEPELKLLKLGNNSLSDAENLSLIIKGKQSLQRASEVLKTVKFNYTNLSRLSYRDLINTGLSNSQAISLIASFELSKRKQINTSNELDQIKSSKDVFDIMLPLFDNINHEEFWILFLNRSNKVINRIRLSQGGISGTVTDVRIVMKKAIEYLASGIIVCHNHPSEADQPSESDKKITLKVKDAGLLMDIQLLDHIIICGKTYFSFADSGVL